MLNVNAILLECDQPFYDQTCGICGELFRRFTERDAYLACREHAKSMHLPHAFQMVPRWIDGPMIDQFGRTMIDGRTYSRFGARIS